MGKVERRWCSNDADAWILSCLGLSMTDGVKGGVRKSHNVSDIINGRPPMPFTREIDTCFEDNVDCRVIWIGMTGIRSVQAERSWKPQVMNKQINNSTAAIFYFLTSNFHFLEKLNKCEIYFYDLILFSDLQWQIIWAASFKIILHWKYFCIFNWCC